MIQFLTNYVFHAIGHTWNIGGKHLVPTEEDVTVVLDKAAALLYDKEVGQRVEVGGLIVEKRPVGHEVYAYLGSYK